eukprot:4195265-Heterocapsa_arctica.AAC.1
MQPAGRRHAATRREQFCGDLKALRRSREQFCGGLKVLRRARDGARRGETLLLPAVRMTSRAPLGP